MDCRYFHSASMYVSLTCHFLSFYAIFALKFYPILTKDFICLNSNNLRKRNPSFEGYSVTLRGWPPYLACSLFRLVFFISYISSSIKGIQFKFCTNIVTCYILCFGNKKDAKFCFVNRSKLIWSSEKLGDLNWPTWKLQKYTMEMMEN